MEGYTIGGLSELPQWKRLVSISWSGEVQTLGPQSGVTFPDTWPNLSKPHIAWSPLLAPKFTI